MWYFGTWEDRDGALKKYSDGIQAGRDPRRSSVAKVYSNALSVFDLGNLFLERQQSRVEAGTSQLQAFQQLHVAVKQIPVSHVGPFVKMAIDDSPTKRYGPKVELAGTHHNPTPGPSAFEFLYGHVWVTTVGW